MEAFEILFNTYYPKLVGFATLIIGEKSSAEEVTSDVFINLWKQKEKITEIENLHAYLHRSVRNRALNDIKKNKIKSANIAEFENINSQELAESKILTKELSQKISFAVANLPTQCRLCYHLVKEEGLSYKKAAEILDISPRTVNAQMVIALKQISKAIKNNY